MKKLFLFSVVTVLATACSNNANTEAEEARKRDSMANLQKSDDQRFVDSLYTADSTREANEAMKKDSGSHEGHDHEGHDHEGHSH